LALQSNEEMETDLMEVEVLILLEQAEDNDVD
jgi:hypothetical protein